MISAEELTALKTRLQELVVEDIGATITTFKEAMPKDSPVYNILLTLEGQHKENVKGSISNVVTSQEDGVANSKVRLGLIELISALEQEDFAERKSKAPGGFPGKYSRLLMLLLLGVGALAAFLITYGLGDDAEKNEPEARSVVLPSNKNGHLLYKIPERMQLGVQTICVIRIAFDSTGILNEMVRDQVKIRTIGTTKRMKVRLLDPAGGESFRISTQLGSVEQFIDTTGYAEWRFGVTPLREGSYPLTIELTRMTKDGEEYVPSANGVDKIVTIVRSELPKDTLAFMNTGQIVSLKSDAALAGEVGVARDYYLNETTRPVETKGSDEVISELADSGLMINFASNSTEFALSSETDYTLTVLVKRMEATSEVLVIKGHADNRGTEEYNLELGRRRAEKVARLLMARGIDAERIMIETEGENNPVAPNQTEKGRFLNRRVEIVLGRR